MKFNKKIVLVFCFTLLCYTINVRAQKTDQVQTGNLWLSGFKPDGDLSEWPSPLKADNKATHISYSLANDDKYLYLAVSTNRAGKIFYGGVSFVIKRSDGSEKGQIIYPYNPWHDETRPEFYKRGIPNSLEACELIEVMGISSIPDSVIGIYNEHEIQVGIKHIVKESKIYSKGEDFLEYELAIPLNILGLSQTGNRRLNYALRLRGKKALRIPKITISNHRVQLGRVVPKAELVAEYEKQVDIWNSTELSGEYILSSKP